MDAKPEEIQIGLDLMLKVTREGWESIYGPEHPFTPSNVLAHVMGFFYGDVKYGVGTEVQSLETTGPDGDPIDENSEPATLI